MAQAEVGIPGQQIIEPASHLQEGSGLGQTDEKPPRWNNTNFNKYLFSAKKEIPLFGQPWGKLGLDEDLARILQGDAGGRSEGQHEHEALRGPDCGIPQHMEEMLPGRGPSNLGPSFSGNGATPRPLLTILGGASTRMTNRTSHEFSPQFCGRTRRLMHTCRFSRALEVQLPGAGRAHGARLPSWELGSPSPGTPDFDPPVTSDGSAHTLCPQTG